MSKSDILALIEVTEQGLDALLAEAARGKGVLQDAVSIMIPHQKTQIRLLKLVAEKLPD